MNDSKTLLFGSSMNQLFFFSLLNKSLKNNKNMSSKIKFVISEEAVGHPGAFHILFTLNTEN